LSQNSEKIKQRIEKFKLRIIEDKEFCEYLFNYATIRLLAFKYAYYNLGKTIVKDATYDGEEKSWFIMGAALGYLTEEETSPCIGFNDKHPLSFEAIKLAKKLLKIK